MALISSVLCVIIENIFFRNMVNVMKHLVRLFTLLLIVIAQFSRFHFLSLSVFLAYIPIELSFQIQFVNNKYLKVLLGGFFILFFPNIPYLVTDMIHMDLLPIYDLATGLSSQSLRFWLLTVGMFASVFCYVLVGFSQLLIQLKSLGTYFKFNGMIYGLVALLFSFISSLGIYVGRFPPRIHSVDFLRDPLNVFQIIFLEWSVRKFELIMIFVVLHLIVIGTILINNQLFHSKNNKI